MNIISRRQVHRTIKYNYWFVFLHVENIINATKCFILMGVSGFSFNTSFQWLHNIFYRDLYLHIHQDILFHEADAIYGNNRNIFLLNLPLLWSHKLFIVIKISTSTPPRSFSQHKIKSILCCSGNMNCFDCGKFDR